MTNAEQRFILTRVCRRSCNTAAHFKVAKRRGAVGRKCWVWLNTTTKKGYAWASGRKELAHRVSYRAFKGEIPSGKEIDHLCRNKRCVNPGHLEAVTPQTNGRRHAFAD